jgi:hypothetical protein
MEILLRMGGGRVEECVTDQVVMAFELKFDIQDILKLRLPDNANGISRGRRALLSKLSFRRRIVFSQPP